MLQPLQNSMIWVIIFLLQFGFPIPPAGAYPKVNPSLRIRVIAQIKFCLQDMHEKLDISINKTYAIIIIESITLIPV